LNNPVSIGESLELFAIHARMDVSMAAEFNSPGLTPQTFQDDSGLLINRVLYKAILPYRSAGKFDFRFEGQKELLPSRLSFAPFLNCSPCFVPPHTRANKSAKLWRCPLVRFLGHFSAVSGKHFLNRV
jgi:hypothetical protein